MPNDDDLEALTTGVAEVARAVARVAVKAARVKMQVVVRAVSGL